MRKLLWLLLPLGAMAFGRVEPSSTAGSSAVAAPGPPCSTTSAGDVSARLRAVAECHVEEGRFAGTILVARAETILLADGWGLANREWSVPNDLATRFRLGSLTKAFTGVLVMRLVQDGDVELSAPIGRYISGLPDPVAERVTVRHLLTHTSGLREFFRIPSFDRLWLYEPPAIAELVRAAAREPLEFEPGDRYAYRNVGYLALGHIIEQVTGLSYEQALRRYVLDPAGMDDSGVEQADEVVDRLASGYARAGARWGRGSFLSADLLHAAGGVYSTAPDLFRFSRALDTNELLHPRVRQRMFMPRVKEREDETDHRHYAFGWHVDRLRLGEGASTVDIIEHGGDVTSFETLFTRVPSLNAVVVILYNHGETDQDAIRDDLIRVLAETR